MSDEDVLRHRDENLLYFGEDYQPDYEPDPEEDEDEGRDDDEGDDVT